MAMRPIMLAAVGLSVLSIHMAHAQEPSPPIHPMSQSEAATPLTNGASGERGPGTPSGVDPAPGAGEHPFAGHSADAFYNVEQRIARVEVRAQSLRGMQRHRALGVIRSIKAELAIQRARHGEVRDWDREHLNRRLDVLDGQIGIAHPG